MENRINYPKLSLDLFPCAIQARYFSEGLRSATSSQADSLAGPGDESSYPCGTGAGLLEKSESRLLGLVLLGDGFKLNRAVASRPGPSRRRRFYPARSTLRLMTDSNSTLLWYDQNAFHLCAAYEASPPRALQATLARWIRPEMQVLELACGSGRDARFMASLGARVTALDGSAAMVAEARKRAGGPEFLRLALPATRSELAAKGLLPDAQSDDGRFDAVVSIALLMHLADEALFLTLRNIANCCRKEGLAIVSFSPDHPAEDGRLFVKRTAQEVANSLEDFGFTVLESETPPGAPFPG